MLKTKFEIRNNAADFFKFCLKLLEHIVWMFLIILIMLWKDFLIVMLWKDFLIRQSPFASIYCLEVTKKQIWLRRTCMDHGNSFEKFLKRIRMCETDGQRTYYNYWILDGFLYIVFFQCIIYFFLVNSFKIFKGTLYHTSVHRWNNLRKESIRSDSVQAPKIAWCMKNRK